MMTSEKNLSSNSDTPVPLVGGGRFETAQYQKTGIERYDGNPYIEALPPILSDTEAAKSMAHYPRYNNSERSLPSEVRAHLIHNALDLFVPLREHLDLQQRLSCMLRSGYSRRNPIERTYWQQLDRRVDELVTGRSKLLNRSSATGMSIIGISGGGKTTATEAALNLTPQVIVHSSFRGQTFTNAQVVWLKLQCPFDGSVRGLCITFFNAMDALLGTHHLDHYVKGRKTVDELLPHMARVASIHGLGILVIDEIQHLSQSKSGGKERMLNFFCQLVNTIGVPVVFIGTFKAISVLGDEFRQIRRGSGEGDFVWERMLNDAKWKFFVEALWTYQYVRNQSPLTPELSDTLYDESQGITDFAVKLYMLAQVRAIASRKEVITPSTIRSVASDSLRMAQPVLRALRNGNTTALELLSDVQPIDFAEQARRIRTTAENQAVKMQPKENASAVGSNSDAEKIDVRAPKSTPSEKPAPIGPESLPNIVASGSKQERSPYDSLKAGGLIRDQMEFLIKS